MRVVAVAILTAWVGFAVVECPVSAQEKPPAKENPEPQGDGTPFAQTPTGIKIGAALQMIAAPNVAMLAAARLAPPSSGDLAPLFWPEWDVAIVGPLPLSSTLLADIKDGTPVPNLWGVPLKEINAADRAFYLVWCDALVKSTLVGPELFKEAGEENRWVTFDHLWQHPETYRGKVVRVTGRMIRLRKWEAPRKAQDEGVAFCYEGWVVGPTKDRNPYCIVFTSLPEGLEEAEQMDRPVRFYGYFIKKIRYTALKTERLTNALIGPTVFLEKTTPPPPPEFFSRNVLFATLGGLIALIAMLALMMFWFRTGDRAVQNKLRRLHDKPLVLGDESIHEPPATMKSDQPPNAFDALSDDQPR